MVQEFEQSADRPGFPMPPIEAFPAQGMSDEQVLDGVRAQLGRNPYKIENDFGVSYVGPPHPISKPVAELAHGTFFTEWAIDMQPGSYQMEKEAVRMMVSLLGRPQAEPSRV